MKAVIMNSMRISLGLLLLVLTVIPLSAEEDYPWPDEYTIICVAEKTIGFNWSNGEWNPVQFNNKKRLIVKAHQNQCDGTPEKDFHMDNVYHNKHVCLNVRELGEGGRSLSRYCEERFWEYVEYGTPRELQIYCAIPKMYINPNGWYHYAHVHDQLEDAPEDDLKDSQYIEVGKCSMIKP